MSLTLSIADVHALRGSLVTLLSPLDYPTVGQWGTAVLSSLVQTLGADQAFLALPDGSGLRLQSMGAFAEPAARAYEQHFWRLDPGVTERRKQLGLQVYHRDMVYDRGELPRNELFNDWCRPHRLMDPLAMTCEHGAEPVPASLAFYHDSDAARQFGDHGMGVLRLLLPAFQAGVQIGLRLAHHEAHLARILDTLPDALMLCDRDGVVHQTAALDRMLAEDPARGSVRAEMARIGRDVLCLLQRTPRNGWGGLPAPISGDIPSAHTGYRVRANLAARSFGSAAMAIVVLSRCDSHPLSDEVLRSRFELTPREIEVARHLAGALSSSQLAQRLGISRSTARRHTENVLRKLGLHSRAGIPCRLHE